MTKLDQLLSVITKKHVYLQMHNYPDQDALASAKGLQVLLESANIRSTICYKGHVDKFNTLKMIEQLHIEIHPIRDLAITEEDEVVLVDCQKGNANVIGCSGKEVACIDHHNIQFPNIYPYSDIRSDVGACSSIIANYFLESKIELYTELATALAYGIKMDTSNLSRDVSDLDIDMFCYLYKKSNHDFLRKLDNSCLKMEDLEAYRQALSDLRVYGNVGIANIGSNCSEAIIGSVSDFLLTLNEVSFTLVYSFRTNGVRFSVRNKNPYLDAAEIIKQALNGIGDGGGHSSMAAGFVSNINPNEETANIAHIVEERIIELASKELGTVPF